MSARTKYYFDNFDNFYLTRITTINTCPKNVNNTSSQKYRHIYIYIYICVCVCVCVCVYIYLLLLATIVEGDLKAPFSVATTPRCRGSSVPLSLDCSTLPLIPTLVKQLLKRDPSSRPRLRWPTLLTIYIYIPIYIYIYI